MILSKEIADELFRAFNIQRWNDRLRPMNLYEMDKHSLKMIIAYCLARYEEDAGKEINWLKIIKYGIYDLLRRIVISDIKSPIFDQIKKNQRVFKQLNKHILTEIAKVFPQKEIQDDFAIFLDEDERRHSQDPEYKEDINSQILEAAHFYASYMEFNHIYTVNPYSFQNLKIQTELHNKLSRHLSLRGMQKLMNRESIANFIDLCGQLRFQNRWAQTPRVPDTSVLGHCLMVAIFSYFLSIEYTSCEKRIYNNFFCGLFHDLPEVATRDIISPVKRISEDLQNLISDIEQELCNKEIYPLLENQTWVEEFKYFTQDEFSNKVMINGEIISELNIEEISQKYESAEYKPIDGEIVRAADKFSAFLEAYYSCEIGIKSPDLLDAIKNVKQDYMQKTIHNINFAELYNNYTKTFNH